jgi:osmotically-inducible protein OsmY
MRRRGYEAESDEWIDDEALQRLIMDRIDNDAAFWVVGRGKRRTMIVVEVEDGYVTLSGIVRSAVEKRRADILARALGALGVDNRLRLEHELHKG